MAISRKQKTEEGAPAWMVTYGDMVTLMLTFFVMLLAMSEVKKEESFVEFMQAIREAFGYQGGVQQTPLDDVQIPKNVELAQMLIIPIEAHNFSKTRDPGIRGKQRTVRDNRRENVFVIGGRIMFPSLSAELSAEEAQRIEQFAESLRGHNMMIRVAGHCSSRPVDGTPFVDHIELSYHRARAVRDVLIRLGIESDRIVVEAAGTSLPVTRYTYTERERLQNDLVEILQIDMRVDEDAQQP